MGKSNFKIGLIGHGFIGSNLFKRINDNPALNLEAAFIMKSKLSDTENSDDLFVSTLEEGLSRKPDLIVEIATPEAYAKNVLKALEKVDFMGLSLSALAERNLSKEAIAIAEKSGSKLYIPHGAAFGLDGISAHKDDWESVVVSTTKPSATLKIEKSDTRNLIFEGPTREVCRLLPRSVNSHAAIALAGIGFDNQISKIFAEPEIKVTKQSVRAVAKGFSISIDRESDLVGVSGIGMISSLLASILRVADNSGDRSKGRAVIV